MARALLEGFRELLEPTLAVLRGDGDPAARTVAAVQALVVALDAHRDAAAAPLRHGITDLWEELRDVLAADIRAMQATGELGSWADPEVMAAVLVAITNGFVVQATLEPDGPSPAALAAQFASLFLSARVPR